MRNNQDDNRDGNVWSGILMIAFAATILLLLLLSSCRSIRYVPVNTVHTEYRYRTDSVRDSIYLRDSVFINQYMHGDTIYRDKTKIQYHFRYATKTVLDTLYKQDSILVPCPVEAKLTRWQRTKMDIGGWAMAVLVGVILFIAGRFIFKRYIK